MELLQAFLERRLCPGTPSPAWAPVIKRLELAHKYATQAPVLDMGAGTGWCSMHLAFWGRQVVAVDYSDAARALFAANMEILGLPLDVVPADITALPFADKQFGSVICYSVLEHIADVTRAIGELSRVTRPGGTLVIGVPNGWGSFSLLNDRSIKRGLRPRLDSDIRAHHEHLHGARWWRRLLEGHFDIAEVVSLEFLAPLLAKFGGQRRTARFAGWDVRCAPYLPASVASDLIFICRQD